MFSEIRLRNDTAANWTLANPVLASGEMGIEIPGYKFKIGDGASAWASLPYAGGPFTQTDATTKSKKNQSGATITAGTPCTILADGTLTPASGAGTSAQCVTTEDIADGAFGIVRLPGANIAGALAGLGITPGAKVYLADGGGYTDDASTLNTTTDNVVVMGWADCAAATASATGDDLIYLQVEEAIK